MLAKCILLTSLVLALSACGKRSSPEPAYSSPPYVTENPTLLDDSK